MSNRSDAKPDEARTENPYRVLHKVVFIASVICLTVQVIEGALMIPYILVYFGFPQVGLQEICAELYNIAYQDDNRECRYPYPLFFTDSTPEPSHQEGKEHIYGPATPPRAHYRVPAWREMISIVEERRAAAKRNSGVVGHE